MDEWRLLLALRYWLLEQKNKETLLTSSLTFFVHLYLKVSFLFRSTPNGDSTHVYKRAILIGISPPLKAELACQELDWVIPHYTVKHNQWNQRIIKSRCFHISSEICYTAVTALDGSPLALQCKNCLYRFLWQYSSKMSEFFSWPLFTSLEDYQKNSSLSDHLITYF